jgi:hypothetical protein
METRKMNRNIRFMTALTLALQGFAMPVAGEVVHYDDTHGVFQWLADDPYLVGPGNYFDPTRPPTQSGELTEFSLVYHLPYAEMTTSVAQGSFFGVGEIEIALGESIEIHEPGRGTLTPARRFAPGESIGPNEDWSSTADHSWETILSGAIPLLGDEPIIGFRAGTSGEYRYGWIELGPRQLPPPYWTFYHPVRWAYETELNTPITVPITVIPEPASLISLLLGLLVATSLAVMRPAVFR